MAHDVFISYSHIDVEITERICDEIETGNAKCWMAPRDIEEGEEWAGAITQALSTAKIFLLVFSSNSNLSDQVMREVNLAISKKLVIVPVKIEKFEPTGRMLYYLSPLHWIELSDKSFDAQISRLKGRISRILESGGRDTGEEGPGNGNKDKKLLKFLIPAAVVILAVLTVFVFKDKLLQNASAGLDAPSPETLHQSTESASALEASTPQQTPSPSPQPEPEEAEIVYIYDSVANSMKIQIFTEYPKGTIYINGVSIEADMANRIDDILEFNFNADFLNVFEPVKLSIILEDDNKEDLNVCWSNFFFCYGEYELSELVNFPNTEYIYLVGDGIRGSLDSVSEMKMLRKLDIHYCPNVEGDINSLKNLTNLMGIGFLESDNIKGDIGVIGGLTDLEYIDLQGDSFSGDLSVIGGLDSLEQLFIGNSLNIKGNINELNHLPRMNLLHIDSCSGIYGNVEDLDDLDSITRLFLLGTDGLEGDVASFSKLSSLERIYLGGCNNIYGNIENLSGLQHLNIFTVKDCPNIEGILKLPSGETVIANSN